MMRAGSILIGLTAGLALSVPVRADSPAPGAGDNPYAPLVARNVFGLNPIPPPGPPTPTDPPPKITPNGIMNLLGSLQVLFKVEAAPGQPAKEVKTYMLATGQREDDIEVVKIDEKAAIITFNNHGTTQDLPLVAGAASSGAAPPPGGVPAPNGGIPPPMGGMRFGNPAFRSRGINPGASTGVNPANNSSLNNVYNPSGQAILGAGPAFAGNNNTIGNNQNAQTSLSPEQQILQMEKNRIDTQPQVENGSMPPLPPTILTP